MLPQIMAAGKYEGMEGYEQHLANLQSHIAQARVAVIRRAMPISNLLGKLTARMPQELEDFGVNLGQLSAPHNEGKIPYRLARLVEQRVVNTNRSYKIKAQLATAKEPTASALLQQAAEILQVPLAGRIVRQEAMLGLVGVRIRERRSVTCWINSKRRTAIDTSYSVMASTTDAQPSKRPMKDIAASDAFSEVKPHIDNMLTGLRDAAQDFRLTTVVYEAATALGVFAAVGMGRLPDASRRRKGARRAATLGGQENRR